MALSESPDPTGGWTAEQEEQKEIVRLIGKIPVRNLYLLMLYASELYRECGRAWIAVEDNPDNIPDLVGEILCGCVEKRLRRRLNYGYQTFREPLSRVRGRIDFLRTYRHNLLAKGKVACVFEDMVVDTARNRLVRTALEKMAALVKRTDLACRCRALVATMQAMGVTGPCPTRYAISLERFGRHDAEDVPMVTAARLALELALPTEDQGSHLLPVPEREIHWATHLREGHCGSVCGCLGEGLGCCPWRAAQMARHGLQPGNVRHPSRHGDGHSADKQGPGTAHCHRHQVQFPSEKGEIRKRNTAQPLYLSDVRLFTLPRRKRGSVRHGGGNFAAPLSRRDH